MIFITVKYLSQSFRSVEIVFLYKVSLFITILAWSSRNGFKSIAAKKSKSLMILRGVLTGIASLSFLYALQYVNVVNAVAIAYLEQIIWVLVGILFFKERLNKIKVIAILLSFLGAFIVMSPNILENNKDHVYEFNQYYMYVIIALVCWGINAGVIKKITKTVSGETQLIYGTFFSTLVSGLTALFTWEYCDIVGGLKILIPVSYHAIDLNLLQWHNIQYILMISFFYFLHSSAFFFAVKKADFAVIMPYDYFRLLFTAILNYFIFDTLENWSSILGYCFIIVSGLILVKNQSKIQNKQAINREIEYT